jgi:hypothetical protein
MKERKKKILLKTASNLSSCVHIVRIWKIDWLAWYGTGNLFRVFERVLVRWRMKTEDFSDNGKNKEHPAKPKESSQQKKQNFSFSILYLFPCVCVCVYVDFPRRRGATWDNLEGVFIQPSSVLECGRVLLQQNKKKRKKVDS